jgi:hypothetical protein
MLDYFKNSSFPSDFLENPEKYLGPNYKTVLNFYMLFFNTTYNTKISNFDYNYYHNTLTETVLEIITPQIKEKLPFPAVVFEIIAMHLLIERGETLKFIPYITFLKDL